MEEEEEEKIMPLRPDLQGPLEIPPNEHRLQYVWNLWYSNRSTKRNYDQNLRQICRFGTVEGFWRCYQWLKRPSYLSLQSIYHLFKEGIKPMWEFPSNINGGTWKLWVRKGVIDRCWENLLLAVVGEQFDVGDEICGIVVCVRNQEDTLSIWNKTASDQRLVEGIRKKLVEVLQLPSNTLMEYKSHTQAMKETFPGHKTFPQKHL
ncbi:eukaryotic translation initiation factor 4E type 2 [Hyalella azteca]|uniref:Eukaryotic translation initiation factor 4E type 2 n=1 Tax=Hyalella azteca TaxID=294128 RepID=A0A8B7PD69_HYAAZ|nr:eukaryotic translation initiation factor 4E type 2 [Hyalella azteca]